MRGVLDLKGILNTDETPSRLLIHCLYCDFSHYVLLQMKNEWPEVWTELHMKKQTYLVVDLHGLS